MPLGDAIDLLLDRTGIGVDEDADHGFIHAADLSRWPFT
jgi:hypothetical protein